MCGGRFQMWMALVALASIGASAPILAASSGPATVAAVEPAQKAEPSQQSFEAVAPGSRGLLARGGEDAGIAAGQPPDRSTGIAEEVRPTTDLSTIAHLVDGPPPPVPPAVVTRDERGRVTVRAIRLTRGLDVDGRLDERLYETVEPVRDFIQTIPQTGAPATQKTDAWIFFDSDNIYVAARCWDTAPESEWVANDMRRDSQRIITNNDSFGVTFDTFYDRRNGLRFYTNPLGAFNDTQVTNEGTINRDWNPVWEVRTGRFEGGWTVEMQIPFKSLRYRPGASQIWGVQMRRGIRRRNEFAFLTPMPATAGGTAWNRISMSGTLVGIEAPPLGKRLDVKPYGVTSLSTDRVASPVVSNDVNGDFGLDAKYGLTQNLTLDLTYNTDFAQVEVDEQQVNLTRFNLLFPEKRDFFLEGQGIFEFGRGSGTGSRGTTGNVPDLFFSRKIGLSSGRAVPLRGGARLTGKVGRLAVGALNIQSGGEPAVAAEPTNFTAVRVRQDLLRRSSVGMIYTGRSRSARAPGDSNQAYGVDAAFSFYENVNFNGFFARTDTPGLEGHDESYEGRFDYNADRYGLEVDHLVVGDAFSPEIGFVRRSDMRRTFVAGRFSPRPRSIRSVRRFAWEGSLEYIENMVGQLETRQQLFGFETEFQNSDRINIDVNRTYEFLATPFLLLNRVTVPVGGYSFGGVRAAYTLGQQRRLSGTVSVDRGSFYGGQQTAVGLSSGRVEITRHLSVEPRLSITWIDLPSGSFTAKLLQARTEYTFTPHMFLAGLLQYNSSTDSISSNLRLRWEYSPGSELFVVYTEERDSDVPGAQFSALMNRALVVKFNRLLRF